MKVTKKFLSIALAVLIIASYSMCALATTASKSVEGYGTLKGILSNTSSTSPTYLVKTSVTQNTDNAKLRTHLELFTSDGILYSALTFISDAGDTSWYRKIYFSTIDETAASRIYGSHEVKYGSTYDSDVVYTSASI